jgi:hypothetical protein
MGETMTSKKATLLILTATLLLLMIPVNVSASPTDYNVKLYFHKVSAKTLYGTTTTTTIMNTTNYFNTVNQTESVSLTANATFFTLATFWLYPKLAGQLVVLAQSALPIDLYLNASASVTDISIKISLFKVNSTDGTATQIATNATTTAVSLSTAPSLVSLSGPTVGSQQTVEANFYLKLVIEVKTDANAPLTVTLTYDTEDCPSRVDRLTVSDHIDITQIKTYLGTVEQTDFQYLETINLTATIVDAFGGYDIASVVMYYIPFGYTTRLGYDNATLLSGTSTSYTVYYYDNYTHNSTEYTRIYWTPYVEITDRSGNTLTEYGNKIGIYSPTGEPPKQTPFEWLPPEVLGIPTAFLLLLLLCLIAIICTAVAIYIYVSKR